ncbi:hypothetical protein [Demequina litorisediminis]|uniref:hypothetical protein n=1 Tax=Demequina litorisediminis TaxID=1849022 RepID=UPI0024E0AC78|nr:hypothetical protein [Demequina litorisediminis]
MLEHTARDRVQRVLYFASGIGGIVFGLLMTTGNSGIVAARGQVEEWYWWLSIVVVVLIPITFVGTAFRLPMRALHTVAFVCVGGFLVIQVLWLPAMTGEVLAAQGTPWLQGINAMPSTLVGIAWTSSAVWILPLSQLVLVPLIQAQRVRHHHLGGRPRRLRRADLLLHPHGHDPGRGGRGARRGPRRARGEDSRVH